MNDFQFEMKTCSHCRQEKVRAANFAPKSHICQICSREKARAFRKRYGLSSTMRQNGSRMPYNGLSQWGRCGGSHKASDSIK